MNNNDQLVEAANNGDVSACIRLFNKYRHGMDGVESNINESLIWLKKAVEQNDAWAIYNLGLLYEEGIGVDKSLTKAIELFIKAHELDSNFSGVKLGLIYEYGIGVEKDITKSIDYWATSAEHGYLWSQLHLACLYDKGEKIPEDQDEAKKWYSKFEEKLSALEEDKEKLFSKLANENFVPAIESLIRAYSLGLYGYKADKDKAELWKEKLEEAGSLLSS